MESLEQYVLRLIIGALVCGILMGMVQKGTGEKLLRFLSGIFLTVTLLAPLTMDGTHLQLHHFRDLLDQGNDQAAAGREMARQELRQRISAELEAYILDKAGQWDTELAVTVILSEDCLPVGAQITGNLPESQKEMLTRILTEDLGIPKENQLWIG